MHTIESTRIMKRRVRTTPSLRFSDLMDLVEGKILALRVPNYYSETACTEVADRLLSHRRFGTYANAAGIGRVGMAFFETIGNPELRKLYFAEAQAAMREVRQTCEPYCSPIDRLRLDLEELWPTGAELLRMEGKSMFVGLSRVFKGKGEAIPHQDILRRDAEQFPIAKELLTQLAANIYLQPSEEGGELEVWDIQYSDEDYDSRRWKESYGLDRMQIPGPNQSIRPRKGELILFNATKVHAVRPTLAGTRVTLSCFVGVRNANQPLVYWS